MLCLMNLTMRISGYRARADSPPAKMPFKDVVVSITTGCPCRHRHLSSLMEDNSIQESVRNDFFGYAVRVGGHQSAAFVDGHVLLNELFGIRRNGIIAHRLRDEIRNFRGSRPLSCLLKREPPPQSFSKYVTNFKVRIGCRT